MLITAPDRSPAVIEAEYLPALTAEKEARERLGLEVTAHSRFMEAAIALRYPEEVGDAGELPSALKDAHLSYSVFTERSLSDFWKLEMIIYTGFLDAFVRDSSWGKDDPTDFFSRK